MAEFLGMEVCEKEGGGVIVGRVLQITLPKEEDKGIHFTVAFENLKVKEFDEKGIFNVLSSDLHRALRAAVRAFNKQAKKK